MKFTPTLNNPYIGVTKAKRSRKWIATISHKGRTLVVGFFIDAVDAASIRLEEAVAVLTARVDEIGS